MNIQVGNVCHIALYQAMLEACGSADPLLASGPSCPVWSLASLRREGSEGDSRSRCAHLGSHLITQNAHIPLSSTKKIVHGHTLFSRPFALPSTISRFSRFSTATQRFSTAKCTLFLGQILFSRPYLDSKAKPFFRSHLATRPLASFFAIKRPPRHGPGQIVPVTDNLRKIWEASIEDVQEGSCIGPFVSEEDISQCLECDDWTPIPRGLKWFRRAR